jgi:uncharacterized protein (DUF433 family)
MEGFGVGAYSLAEAGRLLAVPPRTISRWLFGYSYDHHGPVTKQEPLWRPQYGDDQDEPVLGFRDLLEARIVRGFRAAGLSLPTIRECLSLAREIVNDDHPFSSRRFRTDGATLFVEQDGRLLDLRTRQHAFRKVIEPSFKDLDYNAEAASRWWLLPSKRSILLDPERAFGQPIAAGSGILTSRLAQAYEAEGSIDRVALLFEVEPQIVRDALSFERRDRKLAP